MHFIQPVILSACLATAAVAAPLAPSDCVTPTLPSTGSTNLPSPSSDVTLKYIAIGHGIQNYTCASTSASAVNKGALAVLYDITPFYPGTPSTGLNAYEFGSIASTVLWSQAIPLNLQDPAAAASVTPSLPEADYQADPSDPFPSAREGIELTLGGEAYDLEFLGHHYFDADSSPTFDLVAAAAGLRLSGAKKDDVGAPSGADAGIIDTGAVDWLELGDNGRGLSSGLSLAYRVVTAGGVAEACSISGASEDGEVFSVPYTAQYWFFG
ncbi:hypothetical protein VPNG_10351 [Cytospora leucostoma]|uniref:Malate dehydrogenase n=1 Tax=Cytospora leucostoma TaxID=1230097 RepID=A0A423VAY8_9PEZI|nr:hypothetical protein VPNG_10351 [Cytospora leucostoma]